VYTRISASGAPTMGDINCDDPGVRSGLIRNKAHDVVFRYETEREEDGRWLAEITDVHGVLAYGSDERDAVRRAYALALRVIADRLEHDEDVDPDEVPFALSRT
jgi:predicted RNase H-like HicB family nuclease